MIVFDLKCEADHRFEAWFASSMAFETQRDGGLLSCPFCATSAVTKAAMAPRLSLVAPGMKMTDVMTVDPDKNAIMAKLAALQKTMLAGSTWVGDGFAERARAMDAGLETPATIHGRTTRDEAKALIDEGVAVVPLPFAVIPPEQRN